MLRRGAVELVHTGRALRHRCPQVRQGCTKTSQPNVSSVASHNSRQCVPEQQEGVDWLVGWLPCVTSRCLDLPCTLTMRPPRTITAANSLDASQRSRGEHGWCRLGSHASNNKISIHTRTPAQQISRLCRSGKRR